MSPETFPRADPAAGWSGLVLAGGRSTRMGRDKAQLPWRGRSLLDHQVALLQAAGATRVWVSGGQDRPDAIPDQRPAWGPLGGLASVAARLADGWLLVVAVDMPRLAPAQLAPLLAATSGVRAVCFRDHPLPCLLSIDAAARAALAARLPQPGRGRSLRAFLTDLGTRELPLSPGDADALRGCNTPAEWRELTGLAAGQVRDDD